MAIRSFKAKKKRVPAGAKQKTPTEKRGRLAHIVPPSPRELAGMNLFLLDRLAQQTERKLFDAGIRRIYTLDDLKPYPAIRKIFQIRNERVWRAALSGKYWKKLIKENQALRSVRYAGIECKDGAFDLELPAALVEKSLRRVFGAYRTSVHGFFSLVELGIDGKVKKLRLSDSEDRDLFFRIFLGHGLKKRAGGAPVYSATLFKAGTIVRGTDRHWYKTMKHAAAKRWAPLK